MQRTLRGPGIAEAKGDYPDMLPVTVMVPMQSCNGVIGFKFQDTVATYVDERDKDHPNGYNKRAVRGPILDKYGDVTVHKSYVAGLIGGITEVCVYPAQFGIPCEWGTCFYFAARPGDFMKACADAVANELCPPEYCI